MYLTQKLDQPKMLERLKGLSTFKQSYIISYTFTTYDKTLFNELV